MMAFPLWPCPSAPARAVREPLRHENRLLFRIATKMDQATHSKIVSFLWGARATSWRVESAPPVIAKIAKPGKTRPDPLHGRYEQAVDGKRCVVEYEADTDLHVSRANSSKTIARQHPHPQSSRPKSIGPTIVVMSVWPMAAPMVPAKRSMKKPSRSKFAAPRTENATILSPPVSRITRRANCLRATETTA